MTDSVSNPVPRAIDQPARQRRHWGYGLKIFVSILLALGAASGWLLWRNYRLLATVELIKRSRSGQAFGVVEFETVGPKWLRNQLGVENLRVIDHVRGVTYFPDSSNLDLLREIARWETIERLSLEDRSFDRDELRSITNRAEFEQFLSTKAVQHHDSTGAFNQLRRLTQLKTLWISGPLANDADLEWIERASNLENLFLSYTPITDQSASRISQLKKLSALRLDHTLISGKSLAAICRLENLNSLSLSGTKISVSEFLHLQNLKNLTELHLGGESGRDELLSHIKQFPSLTAIDLRDSQVTDAGLSNLSSATNLQTISLNNTAITDVGLSHLKSLTNLKILLVYKTQITAEGVYELQEALPPLRIVPSYSELKASVRE